ncbi:YwmB family TATA-box binding protein [Virgibacillus sp. DJP39]|uniref:YwmB family TATA-box binding protein n=1 Tax=Virgibacillus sp. DJP39 TaxID=3409790 RepID=UPI003BB65A71
MKKIALIFIFFLLITTHVSAYNTNLTNDEMIQLAGLTKKTGLEIDEWRVTIKENIPKEKLMEHVNTLKNSYLASYSEDKNVIKYSFGSVQKSDAVYVRYTVIIPKNEDFKAELVSVISGKNWNEEVKNEYIKLHKSIVLQYFTENSIKFSCMSTKSSDTMKSDYLVEFLKKKLKLQHITTQQDNVDRAMNKKVITGYTQLWNQKLNIMDKPMNVNIAITDTKNGKTKVTVGTPILIIEY